MQYFLQDASTMYRGEVVFPQYVSLSWHQVPHWSSFLGAIHSSTAEAFSRVLMLLLAVISENDCDFCLTSTNSDFWPCLIIDSSCTLLRCQWPLSATFPWLQNHSPLLREFYIFKVSMTSVSYFSKAAKSPASFERISVGALKSASSALISPTSCSTLKFREARREPFELIVLFNYYLILSRFDFKFSRKSEYSSYSLLAAAPSLVIFACKSDSSCATLQMGVAASVNSTQFEWG